ncbi:hypothetical protein [Nocardia sp. NPDC004750]
MAVISIALHLFGWRGFAAALCIMLSGVIIGGAYLFFTQYLQLVQGLSSLQAGLWLLPLADAVSPEVPGPLSDDARDTVTGVVAAASELPRAWPTRWSRRPARRAHPASPPPPPPPARSARSRLSSDPAASRCWRTGTGTPQNENQFVDT